MKWEKKKVIANISRTLWVVICPLKKFGEVCLHALAA